jgi:cytochrome oxidase Cu insertion factor (SCO1/SenC/PrrC family)
MGPAETEGPLEQPRSRRALERPLLAVIAVGVTICALALVVTAWASVRAANAQRDMACQAEASTQLYAVPFNFDLDDPDGDSSNLEGQQERVKRALEDCGVEFPEGE